MLVKMFSLNAAAPASELQEQLEQTADKVIKRLETQIAHLELLLEEADAKIEQLDSRLQSSNPSEHESETVLPIIKGQQHIDFTLPAEQPVLQPLELSAVKPTANENMPLTTKDSRETLSHDKRRLIVTMAEQGYNVTEIAKATGMGKGEITLMLQLHRKG
jgi:uncharacterized coiled-coil protein SlyX